MNKIELKINGESREARFGIGFIQRATEKELPEDNNIMNIETPKLIYHALAYADERIGLTPKNTIYDVYDYIDSVGLNSDEYKFFQAAFLGSMKVHLPDDKSRKEIDKAIKVLTPAEKKKDSKSGKKAGK